MKIIFTKHALNKFIILKKHGVKLKRVDIKLAIQMPEHLDIETDHPKTIASRQIDKTHILRVVYKRENDIITVITFYPAEKERYY